MTHIEQMKHIQQCIKEKMYAHAEMYLAELIAAAEESSAKQEPVAWMREIGTGKRYLTHGILKSVAKETGWTPLYTHPQPKREWVGLTDEEAQKVFHSEHCKISADLAGILARAIEDKLKEKNT